MPDTAAPGELEHDSVNRVTMQSAVAMLGERDRELVALRYGADLTATQIGDLLDLSPNAVEVALHRALRRLRSALDGDVAPEHRVQRSATPSTADGV